MTAKVGSLADVAALSDDELVQAGVHSKHWSALRAGVSLLLMEAGELPPPPQPSAPGAPTPASDEDDAEDSAEPTDVEDVVIRADEVGKRLDALLAKRFPAQSRTYFGALCAQGCVLDSDGAPLPKSARLKQGATARVLFAPTAEMEVVPQPMDLDVLFEDEHLLVLNKPAGIVVHPAPGNWDGTLVNGVLHRLQRPPVRADSTGSGAEGATGTRAEAARAAVVVHRLDKGTSGVILFAKHADAQRRLSALFRDRAVRKEYLAICVGDPGPEPIEVDLPIGRDRVHRLRMAVVQTHDGGRDAHSRVFKLAYNGRFGLCRVEISTGRTHQIRVHLRHAGLPIIGDAEYGSAQWNAMAKKQLRIKRPMLHAHRIGFTHPFTDEPLEFTAPLPADFERGCEWITSTPGAVVAEDDRDSAVLAAGGEGGLGVGEAAGIAARADE